MRTEAMTVAQAELMVALTAAMAKYDSRIRSKRIKQGLARRKERLEAGSKNSDGLLHRSKLGVTL